MRDKIFIGIAVLSLHYGFNAMENSTLSLMVNTKSLLNGDQITQIIVPQHYLELTFKDRVYRKYFFGNKKGKVEEFMLIDNKKCPVLSIGTFGDTSTLQRKFKELLDKFGRLK